MMMVFPCSPPFQWSWHLSLPSIVVPLWCSSTSVCSPLPPPPSNASPSLDSRVFPAVGKIYMGHQPYLFHFVASPLSMMMLLNAGTLPSPSAASIRLSPTTRLCLVSRRQNLCGLSSIFITFHHLSHLHDDTLQHRYTPLSLRHLHRPLPHYMVAPCWPSAKFMVEMTLAVRFLFALLIQLNKENLW